MGKNTSFERIDTDRLKHGIDLVQLAGRHTQLGKWTNAGEQAGPCPKCGRPNHRNDDFDFHVHPDGWFKCYSCHEKRGDVIEFVTWLGLASDFWSACEYLSGREFDKRVSGAGRTAATVRVSRHWDTPEWQRAARAELSQAQKMLNEASEGEVGRNYLSERGLVPDTWQRWSFGYRANVWDPRLESTRPAIVIPWQGKRITALKYRFITVPDGGLRYTSKGGGQCLAYGLGLTGQHFQTLWLLEGELNAAALWQALCAGNLVNWDVLSFGSESNALNPIVLDWAKRYRQVIVWTDDPKKAQAAMSGIPDAYGLRSPDHLGQKLDANALLGKGRLTEYARQAWRWFDTEPGNIAKVRAELGLAAQPTTEVLEI